MNERHLTAIHEAGHAVARYACPDNLREVEYVTIIQDNTDGARGHVKLRPLPEGSDLSEFHFLNSENDNRELCGFSQSEFEWELCTILAGEAATYIKTGERDESGTGRDSWSGDFAAVMFYLEELFAVTSDVSSPENQAAFHYMEALFWRTVTILGHPVQWGRITALADALMEKETLSWDECVAIFQSSLKQGVR